MKCEHDMCCRITPGNYCAECVKIKAKSCPRCLVDVTQMKGGNIDNMEFKWKKSITIPDGTHPGEIIEITYRTEPYEYTDIWIQLSDIDAKLKYGCPSHMTDKSKLGRLMIDFGSVFKEDEIVKPEDFLLNKKVTLMTLRKTKKDKVNKEVSFSEIVEDSLKPVEEKVEV